MTTQELRDEVTSCYSQADRQSEIAGRDYGTPEAHQALGAKQRLEKRADAAIRELKKRGVDLHQEAVDSWAEFNRKQEETC